MAANGFKIKNSANLSPQTGSVVSAEGDIAFNDTSKKLEIHDGSTADSVVEEAKSATLTNKTLSTGTLITTAANIEDVSDPTKQLNFALSGNTTGKVLTVSTAQTNTETLAVPNVGSGDSFVTNATSATLTNKSISGSTNTITNVNLTAAAGVTGTLPIGNGGTGQVTAGAAFNALAPSTALGGLIVGSGTNAYVNLPVGTDGQVPVANSGATDGIAWTTLQQGAKNYIALNNFENNSTTGWSLGTIGALTNGLPTGSPTFGSGASGNLSIAIVSSGQLAGAHSLSYVSSAATTAGNMLASQAYALDLEDTAKVLRYSFYYSAFSGSSNANFSGTSSNSFGVAVYDVTNSVFLGVAGAFNLVQGTGVGYSTGTFQTGATTASIRFIVYNINATSGAVTMYFDDFFVGPQTAPFGPAMSDWVAYTPTFTGFGTPTGVVFYSRRVGDSLQVHGSFVTGTSTAVGSQISLGYNGGNSNVTIDTTKIINGDQIVGQATVGIANTTTFGWTILSSGANSYIQMGIQNSTSGGNGPATGSGAVPGSGITVLVEFMVPVVGWSSNTSMSADTDTRVIAAKYNSSTQTVGTSESVLNPTVQEYDTSGSVSSGVFTVPVTGKYKVSANITTFTQASSVNNGIFMVARKNGTAVSLLGNYIFQVASTNFDGVLNGSVEINCNAGDTLDVAIKRDSAVTSFNLNTNGGYSSAVSNWVAFERLSGPAVVAATESVAASYSTTSLAVPSSDNPYIYSNKYFDTHNAYNTSTGKYTIPVSGTYSVSCSNIFTTTSTTTSQIWYSGYYQNGGLIMYTLNHPIASAGDISDHMPTWVQPFHAGDTFYCGLHANAVSSFTANTNLSWFSIVRVGN